MAEKGWSAKGLLQPLWKSYPGGRDGLAAAVGTTGNSLSARNTGDRNLGLSLGTRLADELGVSLAELGAPEGVAVDEASTTLFARLESLAERVAYLLEREATLTSDLADARTRLAQLESERTPRRGAATRRKKTGP